MSITIEKIDRFREMNPETIKEMARLQASGDDYVIYLLRAELAEFCGIDDEDITESEDVLIESYLDKVHK